MKCRITFAGVGLIVAAMLNTGNAQAQDVHFTQFDASPLLLNPANTGAFNGEVRVSAIYRDQWRSVVGASAFKTYGVSVDMPIIRDISVDDYLAGGLQLYNDRAGDGNLNNFSALLSVAYHKFLGQDGKKILTVGLQGGYSRKNLDLSKLYFGDEFQEGSWNPGTSAEFGWLETGDNNYVINAGISYAQAVGEKGAGFTIGVGVNNINQPLESFDRRKASAEVGLGMRYTGQLGAIIPVSDKFTLKPAAFVQSQSTAMEIVAGNEFHLKIGEEYDIPTSTAVFAGVWYRHEDAIMVTAGLEFKGFRVGVAYDYNTSDLKSASNNNGGFEISLRYIAPSPLAFAKKLLYPCGRF
jgi:type IX secretion system PorP/SprF family membrane protein